MLTRCVVIFSLTLSMVGSLECVNSVKCLEPLLVALWQCLKICSVESKVVFFISRFRARRAWRQQRTSVTAACLAPSPPWCAQRVLGPSTTAWWQACKDSSVSRLSASASMTTSRTSTPATENVSEILGASHLL